MFHCARNPVQKGLLCEVKTSDFLSCFKTPDFQVMTRPGTASACGVDVGEPRVQRGIAAMREASRSPVPVRRVHSHEEGLVLFGNLNIYPAAPGAVLTDIACLEPPR